MASAVFRKVALDRLSSPEQLDRLIPVTSPKSWIALATLVLMLAIFVGWSILGRLATHVQAGGIIVTKGGVVADAAAPAGGTLQRVYFDVGDQVRAADLIAEIIQTETAQRYENAVTTHADEVRQFRALQAQLRSEDEINRANDERRRQRLQEVIQLSRGKLEAARRRVEDHRRLLEERVVTRLTLERSQQELAQAQGDLSNSLNLLDDIDVREVERRNRGRERLEAAQAEVDQAARRMAELKVSMTITTQVLAPHGGTLIEIKAFAGSIVSAGQAIASIERGGEGLEVVGYLPPDQGKRVEPGMKVHVSPTTLPKAEYGTMLGEVSSVSEYPMTTEGMMAVLQNRDLVQRFNRSGPPYAARITLRPDPDAPGGFAWTSPRAEAVRLTSGTLTAIEIETERKAPITLAIPLLREATGL